jgi:hypothetical protein
MSLKRATEELKRACSSESGNSRISSDGTKSARVAVDAKLFILALAISDIRYSPARCFLLSGLAGPGWKPVFYYNNYYPDSIFCLNN